MEIFIQISTLSVLELHNLQDAVLGEIQRRNLIAGRFHAKRSRRRKPASAAPEAPAAVLPVRKRKLAPLSPRRRAA